MNWLSLGEKHLGMQLGQEIKAVKTFRDKSGEPLYHVLYLDPAGVVFVPGDDLVEPIVGFLPQGKYRPGHSNPLGALVSRDLPGRVARLRQLQDAARAQGRAFTPSGMWEQARRKWDRLSALATADIFALSATDISDVRVSPLVQSRWSQGFVGSGSNAKYCYNYYTPKHYPCGCVATALAQLMRYHEHPNNSSTMGPFAIYVDGSASHAYLSGKTYLWDMMPLVPTSSSPESQRLIIGALTYDAGVTVNMSYTGLGSGAEISKAADALTKVFDYGNAVRGFNLNYDIPSPNLYNMVNPNLDAKLPALLGIVGADGGHALVADGYGYDLGTLYHHLNMGWAGQGDVWYNLPEVESSSYQFNAVWECIYNIYPRGQGEIISGRVTDGAGQPIDDAAVVAVTDGGGTASANSNKKGIYALTHLAPGSPYTISVTAPGYIFDSHTAETGISTDSSIITGNLWGVDFTPSVAVNFTANPASGPAPLTVQFSDASTGAITGYAWDFGDGGGSTDPNPSHTYFNKGNYTAQLTVNAPGGFAGRTAVIKVGKPPKLKAGFTCYPGNGPAPLEVQFTNTSSGAITGYSWDFGDGAGSTDPNPSHIYTLPGKYKAVLTVTDPWGSKSKAHTVKVQ